MNNDNSFCMVGPTQSNIIVDKAQAQAPPMLNFGHGEILIQVHFSNSNSLLRGKFLHACGTMMSCFNH